MSLPVVILVNGILTNPARTDAWTDRMATHLSSRYDVQVEKYEYWTWALTRRLGQRKRAQELAELINQYPGRRIILVGHSNGCAIICDALKITRRPVSTVFLVAAAVEADFEKNGLGERLRSGGLKQVRIFSGGKDWPLRFAYLTRKYILGFFGLGYGSLGYEGPQNVDCDHRVQVHTLKWGGHSAWFQRAHFHQLAVVIGNHAIEEAFE